MLLRKAKSVEEVITEPCMPILGVAAIFVICSIDVALILLGALSGDITFRRKHSSQAPPSLVSEEDLLFKLLDAEPTLSKGAGMNRVEIVCSSFWKRGMSTEIIDALVQAMAGDSRYGMWAIDDLGHFTRGGDYPPAVSENDVVEIERAAHANFRQIIGLRYVIIHLKRSVGHYTPDELYPMLLAALDAKVNQEGMVEMSRCHP
jgi:hypothetical protein